MTFRKSAFGMRVHVGRKWPCHFQRHRMSQCNGYNRWEREGRAAVMPHPDVSECISCSRHRPVWVCLVRGPHGDHSGTQAAFLCDFSLVLESCPVSWMPWSTLTHTRQVWANLAKWHSSQSLAEWLPGSVRNWEMRSNRDGQQAGAAGAPSWASHAPAARELPLLPPHLA